MSGDPIVTAAIALAQFVQPQAFPVAPPAGGVGSFQWIQYVERAGAAFGVISFFVNLALAKALKDQVAGRLADREAAAAKLDAVRVEQISAGQASLALLDKTAAAANASNEIAREALQALAANAPRGRR